MFVKPIIMKSIISSILIVFALLSCKAQSVTSKQEVKASQIKYINNGRLYGKTKLVNNSNNKLLGTKMVVPGIPAGMDVLPDIKFNEKEFIMKMTSLFSIERLEELLAKKEEDLTIYIYVGEDGIPLELYFFIDENTHITAKELENLENYIKKNVIIPLANNKFKGINHFVVSTTVNFKRLLALKKGEK